MERESPEVRPSVLLTFRGSNARSFRDEFEFSFLSTPMAEKRVVRMVESRDDGKQIGVLPVAGVFGANASGKSNLLRAMDDMRSLVLHSFSRQDPDGPTARNPFLLDSASKGQPTEFEVELILEGVRHSYGFVLDDDRVLEEWAYAYPKGRGALLFLREGQKVSAGSKHGTETRRVTPLLRPNALFLSTAAAARHSVLLPLYRWFERNLLLADVQSRARRQYFTRKLLEHDEARVRVLSLLRAADLGISSAQSRVLDPAIKEILDQFLRSVVGTSSTGESNAIAFEDLGIDFVHVGVDGSEVLLRAEDESLGTLVWFGLLGPVLQALDRGQVLLADELDASLHPALVAQVVRAFQDEGSNPNRAQLIFNSHDPTLLGDATSERLLGRDQIWFTEKAHDGASTLRPLGSFRPRKHEALANRYLDGRYGAVPLLSDEEFADALGPAAASKR
ncbi:MAG: ATP-binding protein [Acidimicrobiia bacterium]|nr:ATP-binding protein [Acidimicrobiia bacterium]